MPRNCLTALFIVRSPFREEHLAVVPKKFSVYMPTRRRCPPLSHVPYVTPPHMGQMVAIGAGLGQLVHQCIQAYIYMASQARCPPCPVLSHPIPSCMGQLMAIGAGLGQLVHMVHQCIQAYIYIWHLRQDVPLVPSRPVLYGPIGGC